MRLFLAAALAALGCAKGLDARLLQTAKHGDRAGVLELLKRGANVNAGDEDGWTPLLWAAADGNVQTIEALLDAGADSGAVTRRERQDALMLAAKWNRVEVVAALLRRGASAQHRDSIGWTALMWAALKGRADVVAVLLDGGAKVETTDSDGNTPLILAARQGRADVVKILLARGARVDARSVGGDTAESLARKSGYPGVAALMKAR
jgi:ankyrin repeat protein